MLRVASFGLAFLSMACTAGDDRGASLEGGPAEAPPNEDYAVMFKAEIDDATRRMLRSELDRIRVSQNHYFLGEVYSLDPPDQYLLVFTLRGGERAGQVGLQILRPGAEKVGPYWTEIIETGEGVFSVLETTDVDDDGSVDVVYCRWDGPEARVEAALRRGVNWEVRALPARNDCKR